MVSKKNKKSEEAIVVKISDLPLSCPRDNYLKLSHPKIFLPIEKEQDGIIQCPYCSTVYRLDENEES
tara:strand:- start:684 stop:884 length:201 start_codon:yes stop_codon:yes gene_type:complete